MIKYNTLALSIALARAEFKLKNEGTYLGVLWYIIHPLAMFLLLLLIFSKILGGNIPHYPFYLLLGIIFFNFFKSISLEATRAIYDHRALVKSISFPYQALIGSIVVKTFLSHLIEILLFFIVIVSSQGFKLNFLLYPLIFIAFAFFVYGIALLVAGITIFFMDFEHIWAFACNLLWFGTPIFYTTEGQPLLSTLNHFNPLYYFITTAREWIIYDHSPPMSFLFIMISFSILTVAMGNLLFQKWSAKFPEAL